MIARLLLQVPCGITQRMLQVETFCSREQPGKRTSSSRKDDHECYDDSVKVKRTEFTTGNYKIDNYNI